MIINFSTSIIIHISDFDSFNSSPSHIRSPPCSAYYYGWLSFDPFGAWTMRCRCALTDVCIIMYGTFQFQEGQIIFERGRIVFAMHDDTLDVLRHRLLRFQREGYIEFAEHGHQGSQESGWRWKLEEVDYIFGARKISIMKNEPVLLINYPGWQWAAVTT